MENTSDWIKTEYVPRVPQHRANKIGVHLMPSPYDIPAAFRATWLSSDTVLVEVRYIDNAEGVQEVAMSGGIKASIGRETRRLMAVQFKPEHHDVDHVIDTLHRAIQRLSEEKNLRAQAMWNFKAARDAVDQTRAAGGPNFGSFFHDCDI